MNELRVPAKLYIAAVALAAGGLAAGLTMHASLPSADRLSLAVAMTGLMLVAWLFPLPFAFQTKLYLDTSVIFASILLFDPGVAVLVAATGTLLAHIVRRQSAGELVFNSSQTALQTACGGLILAASGWSHEPLRFDRLADVASVILAGAVMYLVNTIIVAGVISLQAWTAPFHTWRHSTADAERTEAISHLSQLGIGLVAAITGDAHPWSVVLLLLPSVTVYSSFARHLQLRRLDEDRLRGSEANLAAAQRIARLGDWQWDFDANAVTWSDEVFRIFGLDPRAIEPSFACVLARVHPDDRSRVAQATAAAVREGTSYQIEHRITLPDGSERSVRQEAALVVEGGRPTRFVGTIQDLTERKRLEDQIMHHALHDLLTGLPNRQLLLERLEHALACRLRQADALAVLGLDLDRFKLANDSLGHQAGDELLVAVAGLLQSCLRPNDTVARLGGDEFTVLLEHLGDEHEALRIARRILDVFTAPFTVAGHDVFLTASIGIAFARPEHRTPVDVLRDADVALYQAKGKGKARFEIFDTSMAQFTPERISLETDLRRAVARAEFVVYYQPIVALGSGRIEGFEALVRWRHPGRGFVSPADFIPLAEETGLILPIGQWVLAEACRQARSWQDRYRRSALSLSVNLSARQFQHPDLVAEVRQVLRETGLDPRLLRLEITESVVMEDAESTIATLRHLKGLGVQVAIDDFGTGYSSLAYLRRFPVDLLKIDKSFVAGLGRGTEDLTIAQAIISLGNALKLAVVAEGIETAGQLFQLHTLGCELGQGFHFSKPIPADSADALLATEHLALQPVLNLPLHTAPTVA